MQYRQALARTPGDPELKTKHDQAKTEAVKQAKARAQSCLQDRNFPCAVGEAVSPFRRDEPVRMQRAGDRLETEREGALDDDGLGAEDPAEEVVPLEGRPFAIGMTRARGLIRPFEVGLLRE